MSSFLQAPNSVAGVAPARERTACGACRQGHHLQLRDLDILQGRVLLAAMVVTVQQYALEEGH
jgi:hypothetical protein